MPHCRRGFSSSPPPTRVRAAAVHLVRASATTALGFAICVASAVRCSTGSISVSASPGRMSTICCRAAGESARPRPRPEFAAARTAAVEARGVLNSEIPASHLDILAPLRPAARLMLRNELEHERLTGRGYHRIRRVARTIADLDGDPTAAVGRATRCVGVATSRQDARARYASRSHDVRPSSRGICCGARVVSAHVDPSTRRVAAPSPTRRGLLDRDRRAQADGPDPTSPRRRRRARSLAASWPLRLARRGMGSGAPDWVCGCCCTATRSTRRCCATTRCRHQCCSRKASSRLLRRSPSSDRRDAQRNSGGTRHGNHPRPAVGRRRRERRVGAWPVASTDARTAARCRPSAAAGRSRWSLPVTMSSIRVSIVRCGGRSPSPGLLLSESPPGTSPEAFRFPMRNRVIAALSEVVIVVESRHQGGSLITVNEAIERNVPLMAVPGGVHNRAATGTNQLIRDGAGVVVDVTDVLGRVGDGSSSQLGVPRRPTPTAQWCRSRRLRDVRGRAAHHRRTGSRVFTESRRHGDGGRSARTRRVDPAIRRLVRGSGVTVAMTPTEYPVRRWLLRLREVDEPDLVGEWRLDEFVASLTSSSANTIVGVYAATFVSFAGVGRAIRRRFAGWRRSPSASSLCRVADDAPVRQANHRPQGRGDSSLLRVLAPARLRRH